MLDAKNIFAPSGFKKIGTLLSRLLDAGQKFKKKHIQIVKRVCPVKN